MAEDRLTRCRELIQLCEASDHEDLWNTFEKVADFACEGDPSRWGETMKFACAGAYLEAADAMLPPKAVWRAYTDRCATVYAASPFNAAMQARYDGYSDIRPFAICAAHLRMLEAPLAKAARASDDHTQKIARRMGAEFVAKDYDQ